MRIFSMLFMLFTASLLSTTYAQTGPNWSQVKFKVTSVHGDANCHNVDKSYNFSFSITLPKKTTTTVGNRKYEESYFIDPDVIVEDDNNRSSISDNWYSHRYGTKNFGGNKSGNFTVRYDEAWKETEIRLRLKANVKYQIKETITTYNSQTGQNQTQTNTTTFSHYLSYVDFQFQLSPYLAPPAAIAVDGFAPIQLEVDPLNPCKVYTLSVPAVTGAEGYRWILPNSAWLVSPTSTLSSTSIQISPNFLHAGQGLLDLGTIRFEAFQNCDGERVKSVSLPVKLKFPDIQASRPVACFENNTETTLSIPTPAPGIAITWYVDGNKVQIVGGQGTPNLRIKAKGDFKELSQINVVMSSNPSTGGCSSLALTYRDIWLGKPTQVLTDPSGYPTVTISSSGFKNFRVTNHSAVQGISNYSWWVSPNQLSLFPSSLGTPNCTVLGDVAGNFNLYVTRTNACGVSPVGGGALHVESGSYGSGPVDPRSPEKHNNSDIQSLSVYPNPADKLARLRFIGANGDDLNIENISATILDLSGREIGTTTNSAFDVSELPAGIYLVKVDTGEKVLSTKLIVK